MCFIRASTKSFFPPKTIREIRNTKEKDGTNYVYAQEDEMDGFQNPSISFLTRKQLDILY